MKLHRSSLLMSLALCLAVSSFYPPLLHAQQRQELMRSAPMLSGGADKQHYVDELGLRLSMGWLYQTSIDRQTYRLGSGDLLGISLEGNVSVAMRGLRVNSHGSIMIPEVGIIQVNGLLLEEAEALIREKVLLAYPDTRASLTLEQPRTVQVHVVGNIPLAGPQLVFAQTRLDQAIYRSFFRISIPEKDPEEMEEKERTDPLEVPSIERALAPLGMLENRYPEAFLSANRFALRNITINRADGSILQADLIRYLKTGDLASNPVVKEGDIISINRFYEYNPRVSISGAVHESLELEFRSDDSIPTLVEMAGGRTYDASRESIRVLRMTEQGLNEVILASREEIRDYALHPNDRVIVPFDREKRASHSVQVFGEARYTGRFPIEQGETTLYDLLSMAGGVTGQALPQAAQLSRSRPGKTEYGKQDDLFAPKNLPFVAIPNSSFGVRPSFDPVVLTRTSNQFLEGFEYLQLESDLIRDRVHIDLRDTEQMKQIKLFDGDRLQIPRNDGTVFVFGQVNSPGYYTFVNDQTLTQYIGDAGGFALAAETDRVFIIKPGSYSWYREGETEIAPGDLIFVDRVPFEDLRTAREFELRAQELRNTRVQLIVAGVSAIASVITAYVAVTR